MDIVKRCYSFEDPEAVAGCGRYVRREKDGDKIIYILYPYRKKQNMFWIKAELLFMKKGKVPPFLFSGFVLKTKIFAAVLGPHGSVEPRKSPIWILPLYFEKSRESHSFSRNPTRTKVSPMTNGRFTSMPLVARRASCSSSDIEASLSLRFSWR